MTDRQIAPSKPFQQPQTDSSQDGSASDNPTNNSIFSPDNVELYKRYEEGYDLDDLSYTAWLKINHSTNTVKSSSSLVSGKLSKESRDSADLGKLKLSMVMHYLRFLLCYALYQEPRVNARLL